MYNISIFWPCLNVQAYLDLHTVNSFLERLMYTYIIRYLSKYVKLYHKFDKFGRKHIAVFLCLCFFVVVFFFFFFLENRI